MENNMLPIILAIIASLPGIGAVIYNFSKAKPDALTQYIAMTNTQANKLIELEANQDAMRSELRKLKDELQEKNDLIEDWRIGIGKLMAQFREIKTQPVWKPDTGPLHRDGV